MIQLNLQPPEKSDVRENGSLEIHSIFRTIQGEGPFAGTPAIFVRLSDCNLQCPSCDTEYTSLRRRMSAWEALIEIMQLAGSSINLVVLTGGEPFRQNIIPLVLNLTRREYQVQVETNGTLSLSNLPMIYEECCVSMHFSIVCSPKTPKLNPDLEPYIHAYKYIGKAGELDSVDGLPLTTMGFTTKVARPKTDVDVFLQPLDEGDEEKNKANTQACLESCLRFGHRLSLQNHKLLGLP